MEGNTINSPKEKFGDVNKEALSEVLLTEKENAKALKNLLERHKIYDKKFRIKDLGESQVAIPIKIDTLEEKRALISDENLGFFKTASQILMPFSKTYLIKLATVQKLIQDEVVDLFYSKTQESLTETQLKDLPNEWQVYGDLLLFPKDCFLLDIWQQIEPQIWDIYCKILGVNRIAKRSPISENEFRSSMVQLICGNDGWISRKEDGITYKYDITKCMFSDGNITEKMRIAKFDCKNEVVVDLFAGIGYFVIPYLVHAGAKMVYACEWNPAAIEALRMNLMINNVSDRCVVLEGDNRLVAPKHIADRVNLGLIPSSETSWKAACEALSPKQGGWLHIHANVNSTEGIANLHAMDSVNKQMHQLEATKLECDDDNKFTKTLENLNGQVSNLEASLCDVFQDERKQTCDKKSRSNSKKQIKWEQWARQTEIKIQVLLKKSHDIDGLSDWICCTRHIEHVKSYAPHIDHIVIDMECRPVYKK